MTTEKNIICLAKSIKHHPGRCVAGVDTDTGDWVRPVSEMEHGELKQEHFTTANGHEPTPLDVLRIYLKEPDPEATQPENWKLAEQDWDLISETLEPEQFELMNRVVESGPDLLGNQKPAIDSGKNVDASLSLVKPDNPIIQSKTRPNRGDQHRLKFELGGVDYDLPITDPIWRERIFDLVDSGGQTSLNDHVDSDCIPLLTVSLGTEYEGKHWKLVAGIFEVPEEHF